MSGLSFGRAQNGRSPTADEANRISGTHGLGVIPTMKAIRGAGSMCLADQLLAPMDSGHAIAFVSGFDEARPRVPAR